MTEVYNKVELKKRRQDLRVAQTKAEMILWKQIKNKNLENLKFRRQFSFGYYIVDFYCREMKLVIELDGDSHFQYNSIEYDEQRTRYLNSLGLTVLRFTNNDIYNNLEVVLEKITDYVRPHLTSPYKGEE